MMMMMMLLVYNFQVHCSRTAAGKELQNPLLCTQRGESWCAFVCSHACISVKVFPFLFFPLF